MTRATSVISRYGAFLVDVDGVLTHGRDPLPGAAAALATLRSIGRTLVLTNNSTRSRDELAQHLCAAGFEVARDDVVGSAFLAAQYLAQHYGPSTVWVLGEGGIRREMEDAGHRLVSVSRRSKLGRRGHRSRPDLHEAGACAACARRRRERAGDERGRDLSDADRPGARRRCGGRGPPGHGIRAGPRGGKAVASCV